MLGGVFFVKICNLEVYIHMETSELKHIPRCNLESTDLFAL